LVVVVVQLGMLHLITLPVMVVLVVVLLVVEDTRLVRRVVHQVRGRRDKVSVVQIQGITGTQVVVVVRAS
jgi:hypothetical protein